MDEENYLDDSQIKFADDDVSTNTNICDPCDIPPEDKPICKNGSDSTVDAKKTPKNVEGGSDQKVVRRREKSRGRFRRKKHSKTQSVPDLETQVQDNGNEQFSESEKVAGNERKYNSMPRKSRSRSGSASRFSGLFRRKARSASAGASTSKSDTDIVGDQTTEAKEQNTENEPTFSYVRYSPTKQPRNRLKRMTVRDAVQERYSIHSNLYLIKQQKNEVGDPLSSSLPDVSNIDSIDSDPLVPSQTEMGEGGEFNKKCATLPRDKKHKARKSVDMKSPFDDRTLLIHCDINGNGVCPPSELPSSPSRVKIRNVANANNSSNDTDGKAGSDNDSDIFYDCDDSIQNSAPPKSAKSAEAQNAPDGSTNQDISETDVTSAPVTVYKSPDDNVQKQRDDLRSLFFELSHTNPPRRDSFAVGNRDAKPNVKLNDKLKNISTISKERRDSGISNISKSSHIDNDTISKHRVPSASRIVNTKTSPLTLEESKDETSKTSENLPNQRVNGLPENDTNSENITNNDENQGSILNNALINFSLIYAPVMESFKMLTNKKSDATVDKNKKENDKGPDKFKEHAANMEDVSTNEALEVQQSTNENKTDNNKIENVASPESSNFLEVPKRVDRSQSDGGVDYSKTKKKSPRTFQRSASDTPPPKTSIEIPQNAVPIMGTSVSGKYRRKFGVQRGNRDVLQLPEGITLFDPGSPSPTDVSSPTSDASNSKSSSPDEGFEGISTDSSLSREVSQKGNESSSKKRKNIGRTFGKEVTKSDTEETKSPNDDSSGEEAGGKLVETGTQTTEEDIRIAVKHMMKINKEQRKRQKEWAKRKKEFIAVMEDTKKEREQLQRREKINKERKEEKDTEVVDVKTSLPTPEIRVADDDGVVVTPCLPSIESPNNQPQSPQEESKEEDKNVPDSKKQKVSNKKKKPKNKTGGKPVSILKRRLSRKNKKKKGDEEKTEGEGKEEEEEEEKFEDALSTGIDDDTFVFIENEINLSKLAEIKETDILDDEIVEPDISIEIPTKHIRFDTINLQPIQGEEPLPPISGRCSRRRDSTMRERRKKCLNALKKFVAFLFSHIGLCSLVVAYTIMGGFVFKAIEGPHERSVKTGIREERIKVIDKLIQHAFDLKMNKSGRDSFSKAVELELVNFQTKIHKETKENGWDGNDKKEFSDMQWSFASALLYAITVMTTIGYGHVAPKTPEGRIVTIGYAVLGIPLTLLCLTNIGDVMATGFRLLYGKVCCGVCCKLFSPKRRRMPDPEKGISRVVNTNEEEDKPKEVIHVPTSLCILLIAGYIFSGALLFSLWEKWDYLTGSYFCFITLSTIGFGDIVPGTDLQAWAGEEKLVLCALYLVFGLSLIAMCFNLVQEDVKAKCRWLGMKMGIIDKPESGVLN